MNSQGFLQLGVNQSTSEKKAQIQFLRFTLIPDTEIMLSLEQITEVLSIGNGQIVPIPHMPSWIMGVYNWRGEILWMIDLGQLVGLTPIYQQHINTGNYQALVLQIRGKDVSRNAGKGQVLGLVVSRVEDIEWCNPEEIVSPPTSAVTPALAPFLRGYWMKSNGDLIITLDGEAILAAMPQA